ncbi:MAG: hypothetical protein R3C59_10990 [Planctomycetaceae bacterium]
MKRTVARDQFAESVIDAVTSGELSEAEILTLKVYLNPSPAVMNALAACHAGIDFDSLWYVWARPAGTGGFRAILPDGTEWTLAEQDGGVAIQPNSDDLVDEFVPLMIWHGTESAKTEPLILRAEVPQVRQAEFPERLAAAPRQRRDRFASSNALGDGGFATAPVDQATGYLNTTLYLKQGVRNYSHVEMQFLDVHGHVIEENRQRNIVFIAPEETRPTFMRSLDSVHRPVAESLKVGKEPPVEFKTSFKAPRDFRSVRHIQLVVYPDIDSQLRAMSSARPVVFERTETGIRVARRYKRYLGLTTEKTVRRGFLLTVGQRSQAATQIDRIPRVNREMHNGGLTEYVQQAYDRAIDSLHAGTLCSLATADLDAVRRYFARIVKNCERGNASGADDDPTGRAERTSTPVETELSDFDAANVCSTRSSTGGDRCRSTIQLVQDRMTEWDVKEYGVFVNRMKDALEKRGAGCLDAWFRAMRDPETQARTIEELADQCSVKAGTLRSSLCRLKGPSAERAT